MFRDYLYFFRCVEELKECFLNSEITEAFSQQKDTLLLHFPSIEYPSRHLSISLVPQKQYLLIKNDFHRAKKNTVSFFDDLFPSKLLRIKIALFERSIKFYFNDFDLVVVIKGNESNVILIRDDKIISSFKKIIDTDEMEKFLRKLKFDYSQLHYELSEIAANENSIKKYYPFLSNIFEKEALLRSKTSDDLPQIIHTLVDETLQNRIGIYYSRVLNKIIFCPVTFFIARDSDLLSVQFDNYNDALREYLILTEKNQKFISQKKQIENYLKTEIAYYTKTLNKLKARIDSGSRSEEYYKIGNLLKANYHLLKAGQKQIELPDGDGVLTVKLKAGLSPAENINMYFEKAKDEKKNFNKSSELFSSYQKKYKSLLELQEDIYSVSNFEDVLNISKLLKIKTPDKVKSNDKNMHKFREFILEEKYNIYVGKDSKSNDELSLKFSQKNDLWFHARGLPGSHVILRVTNTKENVPKDIIKKVASLAAFYSKAKTASLVPVSYTFAKYVIKRKGMEPGQVQISNEKVVIVKPMIPTNCIQAGSDDEN